MKRKKVMTIFGTRPEAVKMAPVCHALAAAEGIDSVVCVTGQHRDLLPPILDHFRIKRQYDLDIMEPKQSLTMIVNKTLARLEPVLARERPDVLLCHGDTSTAFAAALAAFYQKIPVGHVEAGLRTYNRYSPYPEEMSRNLISKLATYHFCPTERGRQNLNAEGVTENVTVTGNTVIDAVEHTSRLNYHFATDPLKSVVEDERPFVLMTAHRRENYGQPLENICRAVLDLTERYPQLRFVYPVHPSPTVRETVYRLLDNRPGIYLTEPLDVLPLHQLMARCHFVLTDSGGLQEEAPALGKPVLVLRTETERPEAVEAGVVQLAGVETERIVALAGALMDDSDLYRRMAATANPYGDGHASERIVEYLRYKLGLCGAPPEEFVY